ncbi:hypothetical protein LJR129_005006 [Acidovorax sp. LjRoot129]|uniref:hypothetical protein n=1 Tax=unclassified Acidovorax TaxID=2684926 RepID=UPI003ECDE13B
MPDMNVSRRATLSCLAGLSLAPASMLSVAAPAQPKGGMTELQKQMITALPVLPWLSLGETTITQVRAPIQQLIASHRGYVMVTDGTSVETGGAFINLASSSKFGLMGVAGCNMVTLDFEGSRKAQLVALTVDRGWANKNEAPLLDSLTSRYASITPPVTVRDGDSEASDKTMLFDIGRFVVEAQVPQHGTFLTVTFTTKELLKKLRTMDGTVKMLLPYLKNSVS